MLQIKDWLKSATKELSALDIKSASLDCELILAHVLGKDRSYLRAHDDEKLNIFQTLQANFLLSKRKKRLPIAYITHQKEFFGRNFIVNKHTLIPRPESEDIIEILKKHLAPTTYHLPPTSYYLPPTNLIDIGTGSGCLGITAKLEFPEIEVILSDISASALKIASKNAKKLSADVKIIKSDLLKSIVIRPNIIIANLPYVDKSWETSPETKYEPSSALLASGEGKELIKKMLVQAGNIQQKNDIIIFESDPQQHNDLIQFAQKFGYKNKEINGYDVLLVKN